MLHFQIDKLRILLKSSLARCAGTYGLYSLINGAIPFFMLPILTRYLTPEAYGNIATFNIILAIMMPIVGLNLDNAYIRAFFLSDRFSGDVYLGTIVITVATNAILILIIFSFFSAFLGKLFVFPRAWLLVIPILAFLKNLISNILRAWQVRNMPCQYGIFLNTRTCIEFLLAVYFVVVLRKNWQGRIVANLFTTILFAVIGNILVFHNKWIKLKFNYDYFKHAIIFGTPLIPNEISDTLNASIGKILINHMVGVKATGVLPLVIRLVA